MTQQYDSCAPLKLLRYRELIELPALSYAIEGILPIGGLIFAYGSEGSGKTFVVISMASAIASGTDWFGRRTQHGAVIYVAAEAGNALRVRLLASESDDKATQECRERNFFGLPRPIHLLDAAAIDALTAAILALSVAPVLVVIDTLSRCVAGADQNDAKEMSLLVDAAGKIQSLTGAAVLFVHHCGKNDHGLRGSSALAAAADTILRVRRVGAAITLTCEKQKESTDFDPIHLELEQVTVDGEVDPPVTSCRVRAGVGWKSSAGLRLTKSELDVLKALASKERGAWTLPQDLIGDEIKSSSCYRAIALLKDRGLVESNGDGQGSGIRLTDRGFEEADSQFPNRPKPSHGNRPPIPTVPTTLRGGKPGKRGEPRKAKQPSPPAAQKRGGSR